jgi:hypothetical protein
MPDYYPFVARALCKLERNTAESRQVLFQHMRVILVEQLRSRQPPATEIEMMRERIALEDAIRNVDSASTVAPMSLEGSSRAPSAQDRLPQRIFEQHPADGGGPRGRVTISEGRRTLELFKSADASTGMHLMAHIWFEEMVCDAARPDGPQTMKNDLQTVLAWLGVKEAVEIGTEQHDRWARGFEQYLMEGRAPSAALASVFKNFQEQLSVIYRDPSVLGAPITDEIRAVFDRMLASDREIAQYRAATLGVEKGTAQPMAEAKERFSPPDPVTPPGAAQADALLVAKGLFGFAVGFGLVFGLD